jgi:hypothetical protein
MYITKQDHWKKGTTETHREDSDIGILNDSKNYVQEK